MISSPSLAGNCPPTLNTIGVIADRNNLKVHQARWLLSKLGIKPIGRAGSAFVFSDTDALRVGQAVKTERPGVTQL